MIPSKSAHLPMYLLEGSKLLGGRLIQGCEQEREGEEKVG